MRPESGPAAPADPVPAGMSHLPLHRIVLMSYDWFSDLSEQVRADVLARGQRRKFAKGERIYSRGDRADCFFSVLEGQVRLSGVSAVGRETVLDFFGPGTWFGEVGFFDDLPRTHDIQAHEAAAVLGLTRADVEELTAAHPEFGRAVLRLQALRIRLLLMALEQYSAQSLEQRLASRLLMLAGPFGTDMPDGKRIDLRLSQKLLSQLIGSTRQRVNQILLNWEASSVITHRYGTIVIRDYGKLEKVAIM